MAAFPPQQTFEEPVRTCLGGGNAVFTELYAEWTISLGSRPARSSAWHVPCPHFQFNGALPGFVAAERCAAERELHWLKLTVAWAGAQDWLSRGGRISPRRCCFTRTRLFVVINMRKLLILLLFCALKEGEWVYERRKRLCCKFILKFRRICTAAVGGGCH